MKVIVLEEFSDGVVGAPLVGDVLDVPEDWGKANITIGYVKAAAAREKAVKKPKMETRKGKK